MHDLSMCTTLLKQTLSAGATIKDFKAEATAGESQRAAPVGVDGSTMRMTSQHAVALDVTYPPLLFQPQLAQGRCDYRASQ